LRNTRLFLLVLFCISFHCAVASAQNCNPPAITANSQIYNIFSPEQEMILGDLNYQRMAGDTRFIQDDKLLAYVAFVSRSMGLPQTKPMTPY
jgi:predicted Zn-dependent protease